MSQDLVPMRPTIYAAKLPDESASREPMIKQLLFVIFKWKWLILGLCGVFTVAAAVAMALKPPSSTAAAELLLKGDRIPLQISGLVTQSARLPHSPQLMQSEVELLKSREVLSAVAARLLAANASPELNVTPGDVESTITGLWASTNAVAVPDTNIIRVTFRAPTAQAAQRTLNLIVDEYLKQHAMTNSGSQRLLDFYAQEAERVGTGLRAAEEQLNAWQRTENVVALDAQISAALATLTDRQQALRQNEAETEATRSRLAVLERQRSSEPERRVTAHERMRNPLVGKLEAELADAEVLMKSVDKGSVVTKVKTDLITAETALQDLLQRFTDTDRRVLEKKEQVAFLKRELADAEKHAETLAREKIAVLRKELAAAQAAPEIVGREMTALNTIREELDKAVSSARALMSSLTSQRAVLAQQIAGTSAALEKMREKKVQNERLTRAVEMQREAFLLYGKKVEEARIAAGLDHEQLGGVSLVERPYTLPDNEGSRRMEMVLAASAVGLAIGFAAAFGLEFLNSSLRTPADVEHYLAVPVLAVIPEMKDRAMALPGGAVTVKAS